MLVITRKLKFELHLLPDNKNPEIRWIHEYAEFPFS